MGEPTQHSCGSQKLLWFTCRKWQQTPMNPPRNSPGPQTCQQKPLTRWFLCTDTPFLFARNAKMGNLINSGYLCSPWSHKFFVYLFFLNPEKSISKWLGQPNVCALRNWRYDKCLLRREKISVFLSVIFSLEMFPETWKEGCTEELIKLAHIKIERWCEQPALPASAASPASPGK